MVLDGLQKQIPLVFQLKKNKVRLHSTERGNNPKTPTDPMSSWMEARRKKNHIFKKIKTNKI